jgi:transcriptional regulator with XRE-family HTH domain
MDLFKSGKIISNARKKKNMTQKELAEILCVSDKAVSKWERGLSFPDISILIPLSEKLDLNLHDLINGEELKEKKDDEILKETINMSANEINKNKKRSIVISAFVIIIISLIMCFILFILNNNDNEFVGEIIKKGEKFTEKNYVGAYRIATKEYDDGWFCQFKISNPPQIAKNNRKEYVYTCFNLKYKELKGFNYYNYNDRLNKYYISDENYPGYVHNINYLNEIREIEKFFIIKQFDKQISINELNDLKLEYINKNDVLELFNIAIKSSLIDRYGNHPMHLANTYIYEYSSFETSETYVTGYYLDSEGYIRDFYIDIKYGNEYLSDRIKNMKLNSNYLSEEDKALYSDYEKQYDKLQIIKENILKEQDFSVPKELKNDIDVIEIEKNNLNVLNLLTSKNIGHFGNDLRYVEDEKEMKNQVKEITEKQILARTKTLAYYFRGKSYEKFENGDIIMVVSNDLIPLGSEGKTKNEVSKYVLENFGIRNFVIKPGQYKNTNDSEKNILPYIEIKEKNGLFTSNNGGRSGGQNELQNIYQSFETKDDQVIVHYLYARKVEDINNNKIEIQDKTANVDFYLKIVDGNLILEKIMYNPL